VLEPLANVSFVGASGQLFNPSLSLSQPSQQFSLHALFVAKLLEQVLSSSIKTKVE
jgi:hypothetical protein